MLGTTFGSVPNSAQSLACDSAGNLFVVDAARRERQRGTQSTNHTTQGVRSTSASGGSGTGHPETFSHVAVEPTLPASEMMQLPLAPRPTPHTQAAPDSDTQAPA